MGKLSKFVLSTIAFTSVNGQDSPNFQVTSCNADVSKDMDKLKGYYKEVRVNESILFFRQRCGITLGVQPWAIARKL